MATNNWYCGRVLPQALSSEDEHKYLKLYNEGYKNALKILIRHNMRLVFQIAECFCKDSIDFDDIIGDGIQGLIDAIKSYDVNEVKSFKMYVKICISKKILSHLEKANQTTISLSSPYVENANGKKTYLKAIPDNTNFVEDEIMKDRYIELGQAIESLTECEQIVVEKVMDLNCDESALEDVAKFLNLSYSQVCKTYQTALEKMAIQLTKESEFQNSDPINILAYKKRKRS